MENYKKYKYANYIHRKVTIPAEVSVLLPVAGEEVTNEGLTFEVNGVRYTSTTGMIIDQIMSEFILHSFESGNHEEVAKIMTSFEYALFNMEVRV